MHAQVGDLLGPQLGREGANVCKMTVLTEVCEPWGVWGGMIGVLFRRLHTC